MNLPPPPPRRTISPTVTTTLNSTASSSSTSFWDKTKSLGSSSWNGLYSVADKVGGWSNTQSAKLGVESFYPTSLDIECSKAARILRTFTMDIEDLPEEPILDSKKTQRVIKKIPSSALANCQGLAIFTVMRTGFMVSGASGSGIVVSRLDDGTWSAPSGILLHTIGVGFMIGVDVVDVVLILRTRKAVEQFSSPRLSLGGELSITAGPVGNGVMLETGIELQPVWSYVKSKGLWGGASVVGNILIERNDENKRSYGREIKASEILDPVGIIPIPYWALGLHQTILASEGRTHFSEHIPLGQSPAQLVIEPRKLEQEDFDDEDLKARKEMQAALEEFGIDPNINFQLRQDDALLLQGSDLDLLTSPDFPSSSTTNGNNSNRNSPDFPSSSTTNSNNSNRNSPSNSLYRTSIHSQPTSPKLISTPPLLPPRKNIVIDHSHSLSAASLSSSSINITTSGLLTDLIEQPPPLSPESPHPTLALPEATLDPSPLSSSTTISPVELNEPELVALTRKSSVDRPPVPPRRKGHNGTDGNGSISLGLNSPLMGNSTVDLTEGGEEEKLQEEKIEEEKEKVEENKVEEAETKVEEPKVVEAKVEVVNVEEPTTEAANVEEIKKEEKKDEVVKPVEAVV